MPEALNDQLTTERAGCSNDRTTSNPRSSHASTLFCTERRAPSKNCSDCRSAQGGSRGTSGCVSACVNKTAHTAHGLAHGAGWRWWWSRWTICILDVAVPLR